VGIAVTLIFGDRQDVFHRLWWKDCAVARIRKEDPENPTEGTRNCEASTNEVEVVVMAKKNIGSDFHDFLTEDGLLEEATAVAVKRYIAFELAKKMREKNLSKSEMARRMETSRSALDRLLDPGNSSVTLQTLQSAAQALGGRLKVELDFQNNAA